MHPFIEIHSAATLPPPSRRSDRERLDEMTGGELTSADGPVVTPGSQRVCDSLTGDTFGSLQHVAVVTAELHAGAHSVRRHGRKRRVTTNNTCGGEWTAESPRCSSGPSRLIGSGVFWEPWFPRRPLLFTLLYFSMF